MLAVAKSKASDSIEFRIGDAENPPFDKGKFDAVVTRHVLWTLPNPEKALESWRNVLKPGGKVVVIDGIWDNGSARNALEKKDRQSYDTYSQKGTISLKTAILRK